MDQEMLSFVSHGTLYTSCLIGFVMYVALAPGTFW